MIKALILIAFLGLGIFMMLESAANRWPASAFSRWWRKHAVSITHKED